MSKRGRVWSKFLLVAVPVLALDVVYLNWRERSIEPLSTPIELTQPGKYSFDVHGFHGSSYHPEFRLRLPFATDEQPWFPDDNYEQLWSGSPPRVRIEVRDGSGREVLREESVLTRSSGWNVTGALGTPEVEVYKFVQFEACMFCSYRISLQILEGSLATASYQPRFEVATIKAYALLPAVLGFVVLVIVLGLTAIVIAVVQLVSVRKAREAQIQR